MTRTRMFTAIGGVTALALAVPALAAGPPAGVYQGIVNGSVGSPGCGSTHNEGEGYFRVKSGKVVPVGTSGYCHGIEVDKITAPTDFRCNQLNATLTAGHIPINGKSFDHTSHEPIGPVGASRKVRVSGTFGNGKFAGFTQISGDGCNSGKVHWKMKKVA